MAFLQLSHQTESQQLGQCIASVYHHSQGASLQAFKQQALKNLSELVQLEKSIWLVETLGQHRQINDSHLIQRYDSTEDDCLPTLCTDTLTTELRNLSSTLQPFQPASLDWNKAYGAKLRLADSGVIHYFVFQPTHPNLTDDDIQQLNFVLPHLSEAFRLNILSRFKQAQNTSNYHRAVCDAEHRLIEADDGFINLIHSILPEWQGHSLPFSIENDTPFFEYEGLLINVSKTLDTFYLEAVWIGENLNKLTLKEKHVCFALTNALSNQEIASLLGISRKTVENHLANIYAKMGNLSRAELFSQLNQENRTE